MHVKLRGIYIKTALGQLEKQYNDMVRKQSPALAVELTMAQFVAAGMFLCKHANPAMVQEIYSDMMHNREAMAKSISDTTEEIINNAIKSVSNGKG